LIHLSRPKIYVRFWPRHKQKTRSSRFEGMSGERKDVISRAAFVLYIFIRAELDASGRVASQPPRNCLGEGCLGQEPIKRFPFDRPGAPAYPKLATRHITMMILGIEYLSFMSSSPSSIPEFRAGVDTPSLNSLAHTYSNYSLRGAAKIPPLSFTCFRMGVVSLEVGVREGPSFTLLFSRCQSLFWAW
jgi:hypothetical protein